MEDQTEDNNDLLNEPREEKKNELDAIRIVSILFVLLVYVVIFAKIIFLE